MAHEASSAGWQPAERGIQDGFVFVNTSCGGEALPVANRRYDLFHKPARVRLRFFCFPISAF